MAPTEVPNGIVLFHYGSSPYARRIRWYLLLRNIPYAQCLQPPYLPRPDLTNLGISYRRIPLLSIDGSVYADTRMILHALEARFPPSSQHPPLSSTSTAGLDALLSVFTVDSGVFSRAAQLIPSHLPLINDKRFTTDRADLTGQQSFSAASLDRARPEAEAHMRRLFDIYESILSDGREWISATPKPGMGDINAVWPLHWMDELGSLPAKLFGPGKYPKTNAWVARFKDALAKAKKTADPAAIKPVTLSGDAVYDFVTRAPKAKTVVEAEDPLPLKAGQKVVVFPLDTGSKHKDTGRLVGLTKYEVAIAVPTGKDSKKEVFLHAPRTGYRIMPADGAKL